MVKANANWSVNGVEKSPSNDSYFKFTKGTIRFIKKIQLEPREGQEQGDIVPAQLSWEAFSS